MGTSTKRFGSAWRILGIKEGVGDGGGGEVQKNSLYFANEGLF